MSMTDEEQEKFEEFISNLCAYVMDCEGLDYKSAIRKVCGSPNYRRLENEWKELTGNPIEQIYRML